MSRAQQTNVQRWGDEGRDGRSAPIIILTDSYKINDFALPIGERVSLLLQYLPGATTSKEDVHWAQLWRGAGYCHSSLGWGELISLPSPGGTQASQEEESSLRNAHGAYETRVWTDKSSAWGYGWKGKIVHPQEQWSPQ